MAREEGDINPDAGGGIFFHTVLSPNDLSRDSIDIWQVDVRGMDLERDTTTEHDESDPWWVSWYEDVAPEKLKLIGKQAGKSATIASMYTAYTLTEPSRTKLLQAMPPKFPDVIAHHATVQFGVPKTAEVPAPAKLQVVGYASDESLEAAVVSVDGSTKRPDGSTYHITISLDRSLGRKPVQSNDVVKAGWTSVTPFDIDTIPQKLN